MLITKRVAKAIGNIVYLPENYIRGDMRQQIAYH